MLIADRKQRQPVRPINETRLLHEVRAAHPGLTYADLSRERLAQLTREHGVDFTTALFYDRIRQSAEHQAFIDAVEAIQPDLDNLPRLGGKLLVAPAAFYREYPHFGGDGLLARQIAAEFGLAADLIPVPGAGSVTDNARLIRGALEAEPDGSVLLVSFSKGGADVRLALCDPGGAAAGSKVRAWLQFGGLVHGTPLSDSLLDSNWWRRGLVRGYLAYTRAGAGFVRELAHGPGALLAAPAVAPPGLRVINVVGFPLTSHLAGNVRARHARLAALGPNDGSTLLRDAIVEPGLVYPVWGTDHYLRAPELSRLLYRLFIYLASQEPRQ